MSGPITPPEARAMWTNLAAYCRKQAAMRAAEGRHDVARRWRLEAQDSEAKAAALESDVAAWHEAEHALMRAQFPGIAAAYEQGASRG